MEYCIDCTGIGSAKELHQLLAQALPFPDWYGSNLDALYDCLTELEEPTHVILRNWTTAEPFIWGFHRAMADAQQDNPSFTVTFENEPGL